MGWKSRSLAACAVLGLAGCAANPDPTSTVFDPFEEQNRATHNANVSLDRNVVRPFSKGYVTYVPEIFRIFLRNVITNLEQPAIAVNHVLQGEFEDAGHTVARFSFNTVLGLGGLLDPATDFQFEERRTGFGETLEDFGVNEGPYVVLPFLGPSTEREALGRFVDFFSNPYTSIVPTTVSNYIIVGTGLTLVEDRQTFGSTIDSVFYDSEDSYIAARTAYLQFLRARAEGETTIENLEDPYADLLE
ncbi:MlaA family lipoprotein [Oceanomicrobium pacificus]|uniref:VacJ family lipoprotein n=1 Tax=Oceanomicrobium pacificus TaxID=2692916 RepID=A0A6B0TUP4_9RHOB|nr:VacJ family lipoprotein [Oceanomicrobium pacificus]MXU64874.1 VacJ family lipoprotein [Oceanomicrobium pacificus]